MSLMLNLLFASMAFLTAPAAAQTAFPCSSGSGTCVAPGNNHYQGINNNSMLSPAGVYGMPTTPLAAGKWELKVVPIYASYNDFDDEERAYEHVDVTGWSFGASLVRGISDHFGVSFTAAHQSNSGSSTQIHVLSDGDVEFAGAANQTALETHRGDSKGSATILAANLLYDPFKGNFRLPVMLGLGMNVANTESTASGVVANLGNRSFTVKRESSVSSPAVLLGLSPQFSLGNVRVALPFFMNVGFSDATGQTVTTNVTDNVTNTSDAAPERIRAHGQGVHLTYTPWGLSYMFFFLMGEPAPAFHALTFTKTWG